MNKKLREMLPSRVRKKLGKKSQVCLLNGRDVFTALQPGPYTLKVQASGFKLVENFDHPYVSASITEFWRRWHLSLSRWLRSVAAAARRNASRRARC